MQRVEHNGQIHQFPAEATPDQIAKALGVNYAAQRPSPPEQQEMPFLMKLGQALMTPAPAHLFNVERLGKQFEGFKRGLKDIPEGYEQLFLEKTNPELAKQYTNRIQQERNAYGNTPAGQDMLAGMTRSLTGNVLPFALGGVGGALGRGLATRMLGGAIGGGIGGYQKFIPEGESRLTEAMKEASLNAAFPMIGEIPSLAKNLSPANVVAKLAKSPLSVKELLRNIEATSGTQTGLGDIIGSPTAKRLQENVITKIPLSGGNASLEQTGKEILSRGENIVNKYLGDIDPLDVSERLGESLTKARNQELFNKNLIYDYSNQLADEAGLQLRLPNFSKLVGEHIKDLEETNILRFEPEIRSLLSRLERYKNPVVKEDSVSPILGTHGEPIVTESTKHPSLKESNMLAGRLRELSDNFRASPNAMDRNAAKVLGELSNSLKNDIRSEIKNTRNGDLIDAFHAAEHNYKQNYSKFLDKDILKFTSGKKSPDDLVASFLISSKKSDKADQLQKLMDVLPDKEKDLVRYSFFSRAMEGPEEMRVVNPNKLKTLWSNLGEKQKRILIPDEEQRRALDNFSILVGKNQKAVNKMWNPQTGQMNSDLITAYMFMNPVTSLKEILLANAGNKALTSEKFRRDVVARTIKQKRKQGEK
jgi:hypothetical protein